MTSTTGGGATTTYTYDGAGKRLSRTAGSEVTTYLWDPNHSLPELAMERDGSGSLLRRYVRGNDLASMTTGGQSYFFQHDGVGSVVGLTTSSGTRSSSHRYEPYGAERPSTGGLPIPVVSPTNPMRFTGELFDPETGLYHLRAREYDPATGRFLSRDPLPQPPTEPGVSSYAYVSDRPTVMVDPSGMRREGPHVGGPAYVGPTGGPCPNFAIAVAGLTSLGVRPPDASEYGIEFFSAQVQTQCGVITETYSPVTVVGVDGVPYQLLAKGFHNKYLRNRAKEAGIPKSLLNDFSKFFHPYKEKVFGKGRNLSDPEIDEIIDAYKSHIRTAMNLPEKRQVLTEGDLAPLVDALSELTGQRCWEASPGFDTDLFLYLGERLSTQGTSVGSWQVSTVDSDWRVMKAGKVVASSGDERDVIASKVGALEQRVVSTIDVAFPSLTLSIKFDDDTALVIGPHSGSQKLSELDWEVLAPKKSISVGPGREWRMEKSDRM
jgi:RHS repeat-associated protein